MAYINVPQRLTKKDIKRCGIIYKEQKYSYILSDLENKDIKNTINLTGQGFYNYIYDVCGTYLFIIGNQKGSKDINPNKIDFLSKILKFEYLQDTRNIKRFNIPSGVFTLTTHERWLQDDFMGVNGKLIDDIIKCKKTHLQSYERPYDRYMRYLCDTETVGTFKHGLCKDTLVSKYLLIQKDTSIDGYIVKYNHVDFK